MERLPRPNFPLGNFHLIPQYANYNVNHQLVPQYGTMPQVQPPYPVVRFQQVGNPGMQPYFGNRYQELVLANRGIMGPTFPAVQTRPMYISIPGQPMGYRYIGQIAAPAVSYNLPVLYPAPGYNYPMILLPNGFAYVQFPAPRVPNNFWNHEIVNFQQITPRQNELENHQSITDGSSNQVASTSARPQEPLVLPVRQEMVPQRPNNDSEQENNGDDEATDDSTDVDNGRRRESKKLKTDTKTLPADEQPGPSRIDIDPDDEDEQETAEEVESLRAANAENNKVEVPQPKRVWSETEDYTIYFNKAVEDMFSHQCTDMFIVVATYGYRYNAKIKRLSNRQYEVISGKRVYPLDYDERMNITTKYIRKWRLLFLFLHRKLINAKQLFFHFTKKDMRVLKMHLRNKSLIEKNPFDVYVGHTKRWMYGFGPLD